MERKYCIHCRTILSQENRCSVCGNEEFQNIIIQVQNQSSVKKEE
jgi:RNA polymerase subunit RPABC4/transcription elongation factor Spt4